MCYHRLNSQMLRSCIWIPSPNKLQRPVGGFYQCDFDVHGINFSARLYLFKLMYNSRKALHIQGNYTLCRIAYIPIHVSCTTPSKKKDRDDEGSWGMMCDGQQYDVKEERDKWWWWHSACIDWMCGLTWMLEGIETWRKERGDKAEPNKKK